jgi:hypothetical protein
MPSDCSGDSDFLAKYTKIQTKLNNALSDL